MIRCIGFNLKLTALALALGLSGQAFAASSDDNPISVAQTRILVNTIISDLIKEGTIGSYNAGFGIAISDSNVISNTLIYTGINGITVNGTTISHNFVSPNDTIRITPTGGGTGANIVGNYENGTGIVIEGNKISATGASEAYTGVGAIDVTGAEISSVFTGVNGVHVDNTNAIISGIYQPGNTTMLVGSGVITGNYQNATDGTVKIINENEITGGYVGGVGIQIDGNTISSLGPSQAYTGEGGIEVDNVTNIISQVFTSSNGSILITSDGDFKGNYKQGAGIAIDNTTGTISGDYREEPGSGITVSANAVIGQNFASSDSSIIINGSDIIGNYQTADTTLDITGNQIRGNYQNAADSTVIISNTNQITGNYSSSDGSLTFTNNDVTLTRYAIGDQREGGTIFYLDETGRHGLMLQSTAITTQAIAGFTGSGTITGQALANGVGAGMVNSQFWLYLLDVTGLASQNTAVGFALSQSTTSTGGLCPPPSSSTTAGPTCYGGWYLPSVAELQLLFLSGIVQALNCGSLYAWSSSAVAPYDRPDVYIVNVTPGSGDVQVENTSASPGHCVLPIRQF